MTLDLLPGETGLDLKPDPYFGMVDVGAGGPVKPKAESPRATAYREQRAIDSGRKLLDGDEQNRVEVLTGKRLQQRPAPERGDLPPVDLPAPTLTSLSPNTVALGQPDFDIHVMGTGFAEGAVIVWNGGDEPTTRVSETELTTGVNMATAQNAVTLPVLVRNPDDQITEPMDFTFTAAEGGGTQAAQGGQTSHEGTGTVASGAMLGGSKPPAAPAAQGKPVEVKK
jgi:hypothetical protein